MIKSKNFNNLSDEMIPTLGRDEVAIFRSVHNSKDPSGIGIYPTYIVPPKDTVWDKGKNQYVDIALQVSPPAGEKQDGQLEHLVFEKGQKGTIVLRGTNPRDVLRYQYLKLCNFNVSNSDRNPETFAIFEEVNEADKLHQTLSSARKNLEIETFALTSPIPKIVAELKNRGIETKGLSEDKIRAKALEEGKKLPFGAPLPEKVDSTDTKALVMEALEAGLVSYDAKDGAYKDTDGNKVFEIYKSVANKEEKFAEFLDGDEKARNKMKALFN